MKERGFGGVTVFERDERVGGKSCTLTLDGRPHDLGATMGVPLDYEPVLRWSRAAGIGTVPFPAERHHSLATGRTVPLNAWHELPGVLARAPPYFVLHALRWRRVHGTGPPR